MNSIHWVGRGTYYKDINRYLASLHIPSALATTNRGAMADILVNYGFYGERAARWQRNNSYNQYSVVINPRIFGNKYKCIEAVKAAGVPVPESIKFETLYRGTGESLLSPTYRDGNWIVKPYWSFGGRGIAVCDALTRVSGQEFYLQKRIKNRRYELRVHVALWLPKEKWLVSKRIHPDGDAQLTWNHHQGGSFQNIDEDESNTGVFKRAKDHAERAAKALHYGFCSVDFIVQNPPSGGPLPLYFIEANLATGFTSDRTRDWYFYAFEQLARFDLARLQRIMSFTSPLPPAETPPEHWAEDNEAEAAPAVARAVRSIADSPATQPPPPVEEAPQRTAGRERSYALVQLARFVAENMNNGNMIVNGFTLNQLRSFLNG